MRREVREQRRAIKRELKEKERAYFKASLPAPQAQLQALLEYVANSEEACDHTLKDARAFIREQGLPEAAVVAWLQDHGGFCDCEVVFNVRDTWDQMMG